MRMVPSRRPISLWTTVSATLLALLAIVASSIVAAPALARQRPGATTPSAQTAPAPHDLRTLARQRAQRPTPAERAAALAKVAKLPTWKPNAHIVTSSGTARPAARSAASPNLVTTDPNNWTSLGPGPVNVGGVLQTGPVIGVATSATDPQDLWIAAYGKGGLWHSTDAGATWTAATDALMDQDPGLYVGWVAVDPTNDQVIYISGSQGIGLYKSTDDGVTWTATASALANTNVNKLAIDPANGQNLLVAGSDGIWRSADGGVTWTQTLTGADLNTSDGGTDVVFDPANSAIAYAALGTFSGVGSSAGGVYQSLDGGVTWSLLTGGPTGTSVGLTSLALSHDGARLYVSAATAGAQSLFNSSLYVFDAGSATWTSRSLSGTPVAQDPGNWNNNNVVGASPADSTDQTVYLGSNFLYRSTDGGATWAQVSGSTVGSSINALAFPSATSGDLVAVTWQGVWSYAANTGTWTDDNATLATGVVDSLAYGDQGPDSPLIAGYEISTPTSSIPVMTQYPAGATGHATWSSLTDPHADLATTMDWSNNANVYTEYTDCSSACTLQMYKSTNGGAGPFTLTGFSTTDAGSGLAPVMSQVHPQTLLEGTTRVWETTDGATTWHTISPQLDMTPQFGSSCTGPADTGCPYIMQVAVAPSTDDEILAVYSDGQTYGTTDGGATWYSVPPVCTGQAGCANDGIDFAISPANPQVIYAAGAYILGAVTARSGSGWCHGNPGIFVSTNGGHNWSLLPGSTALPVNCILASFTISPSNPNLLVVEAALENLISFDGGLDWSNMAGVPTNNYPGNSAFFSHDGSRLLIGTSDRGILAIAMPHLTLSQQAITLTTLAGSSPASQQITLGNTGQGALSWSTSNLPSWLSVTPSSGSINPGQTQTVTLSFNTSSTTPQTYTAYLDFHTNADNPLTMLPVTVSSRLSKTWYFAEGYTGGSFTEYLTLANPNPVTANVSVQYLLQNGAPPITRSYTVGANARHTVNVNRELGIGVGVSLVVTSDQPIIAERPMYFTFSGAGVSSIPGGTDVLGATALGTQFDFGYLDTSANHATYLTVLNPLQNPMTVTVDYYAAAGGTPTVVAHTVSANARGTILVNGDVPAGRYSALVTLSQPGLVERPLYLRDSSTGFTGAADVIGVAAPATAWAFAEGYTNANFSERYILSNPSTSLSANVSVTFLKSDGTTQTASVTLAPGQQQVVSANSVLGGGVNNSATVSSDQPVLAERFMSFTYHGPVGLSPSSAIPGATDVLGATNTGQVYDFAEGYTGGSFGEYLTLENPNPSTTQVTVEYLPQSGAAPTIETYFVSAHSRYTVLTNQVMPEQSFSMVVLADQPIVAERPMYFVYNGSQTGGTDVVGYQP